MTRSDELFSKGHFLQMECFSHRRGDPGGPGSRAYNAAWAPRPSRPSLSCRHASIPAGRSASRSGRSWAPLSFTEAERRLWTEFSPGHGPPHANALAAHCSLCSLGLAPRPRRLGGSRQGRCSWDGPAGPNRFSELCVGLKFSMVKSLTRHHTPCNKSVVSPSPSFL